MFLIKIFLVHNDQGLMKSDYITDYKLLIHVNKRKTTKLLLVFFSVKGSIVVLKGTDGTQYTAT